MIESLAQAADQMQGVLHGDDRHFAGISTDTRTIRDGELFFALSGPNFDGRDYAQNAASAGAAATVVSSIVDGDFAQITVNDTKLALGRFAAAWRRSKSVSVVGITGSNGKTTLKEMVAACLRRQALTLATEGNLNNDIGMPLMLARINDDHEFAVLEMGANHVGEIAYLASLAAPDVVVITNAGEAHLEGFGSRDAIAHAKGEILQTEDRPRVAVLNADDNYFNYWCSLVEDIEFLSFGLSAKADVRAEDIQTRASGSLFVLHLPTETIEINLPIPGLHNVKNACAAAAIASALNVDAADIKAGLEGAAPVDGRLQPLPGLHSSTLFDDSYNANPLSVIAAADFLADLDGQSWLVLGDMKELGDDAEELHREVGASARASGIDRLFALGDLARFYVSGFGEGAQHYAGIDALIADLDGVQSDINVLVKGSRSMHMERVVDALRADDLPVRRKA